MDSHFSKTLRTRLKGINLSQLSRELNIPSTLLFEWKQSKRMPSFKNMGHVKRLAVHLGLTFEELLFGDDGNEIVATSTFEVNKIKFRVRIERVR